MLQFLGDVVSSLHLSRFPLSDTRHSPVAPSRSNFRTRNAPSARCFRTKRRSTNACPRELQEGTSYAPPIAPKSHGHIYMCHLSRRLTATPTMTNFQRTECSRSSPRSRCWKHVATQSAPRPCLFDKQVAQSVILLLAQPQSDFQDFAYCSPRLVRHFAFILGALPSTPRRPQDIPCTLAA